MSNRRMMQLWSVFSALLLLVAGCSGGEESDDGTDTATAVETADEPTEPEEEGPTDDEAEPTDDADEPTEEDTGASDDEAAQLTEPITICEIVMLTGAVGFFGTELDAGAQIGLQRINEEGGIHGAELVYETFDNASDTDQTVTIAENCVSDPNYVALVSHTTTANQLASMPDIQAAGMPALSTSVARPIPEIGEYIFRTSPADPVLIPDMVAQVTPALGIETVAYLHVLDDPSSDATYQAFLQAFEELGVETVADQTYLSTDTDYSSQLLQIREADPDVVVIAAFSQEGGNLLLQARNDIGITEETPIFAGAQLNSQAALDQAGAAANNMFVPDFWHIDHDSPENADFVERFEAEYGRAPTRFAATGYNTARVLATALLAADDPYDRDSVQQALAAIDTFQFVGCPQAFDDIGAGDCTEGSTLPIVARDGSFEVFDG